MTGLTDAETPRQALDHLRSASPRPLSIRQLSRRLGYSSDRALGMVLQGKRAMSADMMERICRWGRLTKKEMEYLRLLIRRERIQKQGLSDPDLEIEIQRFKQPARKDRRIQGADLEGLIPWYAYVLLELIKMFNEPVPIDAFMAKLRGSVSRSDVERTLENLAHAGFLYREQNGYYRALLKDEHLSTPIDVPSQLVRVHTQNQLGRAAQVLEEQSVFEREFCMKTFIMASDRIDKIKKRIREMMQELESEFMQNDPEPGSRVVQFNVQFYQQTK